MNKKIIFLISAIVLIGGFFIATSIYKTQEIERLTFLSEKNFNTFVREYSPRYGNPNAKVFITEFLDPECESCRAIYPTVKDLLKKYGDKVQLVVRYAAFHHNSKIAISALEASRKQNKFWESLEILFKYQPEWGSHHNPQPGKIFEYLPQVGIDVELLRTDMMDPEIKNVIMQDQLDLKQLSVRKTPTFFVNGKPLEKFGLIYLKNAIDSEVMKYYGSN
jgi:protein-disulfide isomerase